jgi:nucleoside-diphosphate-sugar epimerase
VAGSRRVIVEGARALFRAAISQARPPRIVHLSSMSVYGLAIGITDESGLLREDLGHYSAAKIEAEHHAASYPSVITLRPSCVFGPGSAQWSERIAQWLLARRIGDLGSAGDGFANLLYIDDLTAAILSALRISGIEGQAFNLSNVDPLTWNDYFLRFAIALGAVPIQRISMHRLAFETRVLAPTLLAAQLLAQALGLRALPLPAPMPPSLLHLWQKELLVDGRKAQRLMNLQLTPIGDALRCTAAALRGSVAAMAPT